MTIDLQGNTSYRLQGDQVSFSIDRVVNTTTGYTTGTIKFELWAFPSRYNGSTLDGYKLAEYDSRDFSDGQLSPGEFFSNIRYSGPLETQPPSGEYFVTIAATEFTSARNNGGFSVADFTNMSGTASFGQSTGSGAPIDLQGAFSYRIADGTVTVEIDRVVNTSQSITTGTLQFELWALDAPYSGSGRVNGFQLAEYRPTGNDGRLEPGQSFFDIRFSDSYDVSLPRGSYAIALFVTQFTGDASNDGFTIADFGNFDDPFTVGPVPGGNLAPDDIFWTTSNDIAAAAGAGTIVGVLGASDPDGDRLRFDLFDDAGGRFALSGTSVVYDGAPALLAPGHTIGVRVTDPAGAVHSERLAIDVLGASPTPGGGLSVGDARVVALLYEAGLDRDGAIDLRGLNFWIDRREAGLAEIDLATLFLNSDEFQASAEAFLGGRIDLTDANLRDPTVFPDRDYVSLLYGNVLDRPADPSGRAFWLGVLDDIAARPGIGEVARERLLLRFATSEENVEGSPFIFDLAQASPGEWAFL